MRIGEFATKYDLSHDTVRYYMQMGLLLASKNGGQYEFTSRECEDMDEIRQLKLLDFSLAEIQQILSYKRVTGLRSPEERNHYLAYFVSKQKELGFQEMELRKKKTSLNGIINGIQSDTEQQENNGFPLSFLQYLQCPCCHRTLSIDNGKIVRGMVMEGKILCECGYHGEIREGIYVDPQSIRPKILNGEMPPNKEEYTQHTSPKFINFLSTGIYKIQEKLLTYQKEPAIVLEAGSCIGFCLSQMVETLPEQTVYLMSDYDLCRVKKSKSGFEKKHKDLTLVFFACDLHRLPLADECVDYGIDYVGTRHFGEQHQMFLPDLLTKYIRKGGILIGTYHFFDEGSKGFQHFPEVSQKYFDKHYFLENLTASQWALTDQDVVGPVNEGGKYNAYVDDNNLYQLIYTCRKRDELK